MKYLFLIGIMLLLLPIDGRGEWEVHVNSNRVTDVWADGSNLYWGSGFGVVIFDPAAGMHTKLLKSVGGLASNEVTAIALDEMGRLWVGTGGRGVSVLRPGDKWTSINTGSLQLLSDEVSDIAVWDVETLVGTSGGMSYFRDGLFRTFFDAGDWSGGDCHSVLSVGVDGEIFLVGTECGCFAYDVAGNVWSNVISGRSTVSMDYDDTGIFWIVTSDSIYAFDGSELELISKQFIRPDLIYDISAKDSVVWVAGSNGPARYDFSTRSWAVVTEGLTRDLWDAKSVHITDEKEVWIGTDAGAAVLSEDAWVIYVSDGPAGNYVEDMEIDREGRIWCATGTRSAIPGDVNIGLMRYDGFQWDRVMRDPLVSNAPYCLDVSPIDGSMFVGFWGQGLMRHDAGSGAWDTLNTDLESKVVSDVYIDPGGTVFLGEYLTGLGVLCPDTVIHYSSQDDPICVNTRCVTAVGPGPAGTMIGSYLSPDNDCLDEIVGLDVGGDCVDKSDDECRVWTSYEGYAEGNAYDFEVDIYGVTWLATSGGLSSFDGKWRTVNTTMGDVWDVEVDSYGTKWVGAGEGLYVLDGFGTEWADFSETFMKYDSSNSPLDDSPVKALAFDADGALWIGTGGGGIFKFSEPRVRPARQWVDVFPNPYYSWEDRDGKGIRFIGFMPGERIRIYTVAGDLVAEIDHDGPWYGRNMDGDEVVSGVYIYHAYAQDRREFVGKLVIVR